MKAAFSIVFAAALVVSPSSAPHPVEAQQASGSLDFRMERLGGPDRYATAAEVSRASFPGGAAVVFVATGFDFPDSLAAGPAAQSLGGPVLLTRPTALPAATRDEIARLAPQQIYVAGSAAVVSEQVRQQLAAMAPGGATRVAGADRYATAAAISESFFPTASVAYIATGHDFPDALASGAAAVEHDGVLLLVEPEVIPAETRAELERLNLETIVIAGSAAVVSAAVEQELQAYANTVVRRGGADRYETAALISQGAFPEGAPNAYLATGFDFPDALSAAPAPGGPVMLVRPTWMPPSVLDELVRLGPDQIFGLGSSHVVADGLMRQLQQHFGICTVGDRPPAGAIEVIDRVSGATGQVALTFDMGGRMEPAASIMEFLVDNQVCSTIFPTGIMSQTDEGQAVLDTIRRHPHLFEVGNHTMYHCNFRDGGGGSPTGEPCPDTPPSAEFMTQSMLDARAIIEAGTHQATVPFWRPTYGAYDSRVLQAVAAVGYTKAFMWDIDTIDWLHPDDGGPTPEEMANQVVREAASGSNVLMHLGGWNTRDALPAMVDGLRERGFSVTTLSEMLD